MKRIFSTVLLGTLLILTIFALKQTDAQTTNPPATSAITSRQ